MERFHRSELYDNTRGGPRRGRRLDADFSDAAHELREISSQEQAEVNNLLAKWIAGHFRPLIMIEDQGFIYFVLYITRVLGHGNVPLPKCTQLRGCIIALAAELRGHVKKEIKTGCEYFSVTADIWTGRNGHFYISFTIHYVYDEFYPRNWTLEVKEISGRHSGELIAGFLDDILGDWELNKERCTRLVRDSGANMFSCGNILGLEHVSCLAHDIHLVLSGAMSKDKNT
ncbi:unnamed protein product [Phytophthora fragariaefolia]|uniref:Unnamed protein product n=1 Tax=Phytophthora fragariaefolia TaxID=1490495 RepID=A0A9W6UBP1_9STRA|nr:unnamed protein product [Phytophthora fragariaefolia]